MWRVKHSYFTSDSWIKSPNLLAWPYSRYWGAVQYIATKLPLLERVNFLNSQQGGPLMMSKSKFKEYFYKVEKAGHKNEFFI